jgi:hypothetical protein
MTYAGGTRYEGEWRDGKKNGHGVLTLADGHRYDGGVGDNEINLRSP